MQEAVVTQVQDLGLVEPDCSHTVHDLCFLLLVLNSPQKLWAAPVVAEQQDVSSVKCRLAQASVESLALLLFGLLAWMQLRCPGEDHKIMKPQRGLGWKGI